MYKKSFYRLIRFSELLVFKSRNLFLRNYHIFETFLYLEFFTKFNEIWKDWWYIHFVMKDLNQLNKKLFEIQTKIKFYVIFSMITEFK